MYASAMTMLEKKDGESGSYLEMADFISNQGAGGSIETDLAQLFRRVLFNVLVSNRDDHLRNHGFIRVADGWRLSDAFDMNPNLSKATHALALDDANPEPDIEVAISTAEFYRLSEEQALDILDEVVEVVSGWEGQAKAEGLSAAEIDRMKSAFLV
jgi:serine/threonine-protein kinase HipA